MRAAKKPGGSWVWSTVVTFLSVVLLSSGFAFAEAAESRRWAVLVGVSDYADTGISPLRYAAGDAAAIGEALLAVPYSGYSRETVKIVAGRGPDSPTRAAVEKVFREIRADLVPGDSLLVFVSSHGIDVGQRAFLVMGDTTEADVESTGFPIDELFRLLRSLPVRTRILLIDACHSGASKRFPQTGMGYALHDALEQGSTNAAVLSSSKLGQESFESEEYGRGVFTYFLSQALRGAEGVDRDHDGQVSLEEAAIYTERRLLEWGRRARRIQQPWLVRTGSGAPPIITSLVPVVDAFGAQAKSTEVIGTVRLKYRIGQQDGMWVVRGSVSAEGITRGRGRVSLVVVLDNGETLNWKVPIDPASPLNVLQQRKVPARPIRVFLEEKLYNLELTSFVPIRVETEEQ